MSLIHTPSTARLWRLWLLFVICLTVLEQNLAIEKNPPRDLSQFEVIGPFTVQYTSSPSEIDGIKGEVREFLWTHWLKHKRGTVTVTDHFVEGVVRVSYYVEPDNKGRWGKLTSTDYPYVPKLSAEEFACSQIERVEPNRLEKSPPVAIPDAEARTPEKYLLHPLCDHGDYPTLW